MLSCFFLLSECEQPGKSRLRLLEADISLGKGPGEADSSRGKRPGKAAISLEKGPGSRLGEAAVSVGKCPQDVAISEGKRLGVARRDRRPSFSHLTWKRTHTYQAGIFMAKELGRLMTGHWPGSGHKMAFCPGL